MSVELNQINLSGPKYFHRDYQNDLVKKGSEDKGAYNQLLRSAQVALPFVALYKPFGQSLAFVMGGSRALSCLSKTYTDISEGKSRNEIASDVLQSAVVVIALGSTLFVHPLGMLVTTCHDIGTNIIALRQAWLENDSKKAREAGLQLLNNGFYMGLFFTGYTELIVSSLAMQILSGAFHSYQEYSQGNYIEAVSSALMVMVRMNQASAPVKELHQKWQTAIRSREKDIISCNTAKSEISTSNLFKYSSLNEAIDKDPMVALHLIKTHVYRPDDRGECCIRALKSSKIVPLELIQICLPSKIYLRERPDIIDELRKTALSATRQENRHLSHFFTLSNVENCLVRDNYFLNWFKYEFKQIGGQEEESVNDFFSRKSLSNALKNNFISKCPAEIRDIISHIPVNSTDCWWHLYLQHSGPNIHTTGGTIKYSGPDKFDLALRYNVFSSSSILFYGDTKQDRGIWRDTFSLLVNCIQKGDPRNKDLLKKTFPSPKYRTQHQITLNGYLDTVIWHVCQTATVDSTKALEVLRFLKEEGIDLQQITKTTKHQEIIKFFEKHKII